MKRIIIELSDEQMEALKDKDLSRRFHAWRAFEKWFVKKLQEVKPKKLPKNGKIRPVKQVRQPVPVQLLQKSNAKKGLNDYPGLRRQV